MILRGCGCVCSCMSPSGRQWASGLSLLLSAIRVFSSSAAHGWNGRPPGTPDPMLKNRPGPLGSTAGVPGAPPVPLTPLPAETSAQPGFRQMPERSGRPLATRGAGASRSSLPSAVRGTPGVGNGGHCAIGAAVDAPTMATRTAAGRRQIMALIYH